MSLAPMSGSIAVIDVETTGLYPSRHDRIVEVAAVIVGADWRVEHEFVSLLNPERDIGPSSIHGLTSADILHAPQFAEIAGSLSEVLSGTVAIAAHNVRFDLQFLESEFSRLGYQLPDCFSICTMQMAGGGKLVDLCRDYGIAPEGEAHQALTDARAAAQLLVCLLSDLPGTVQQLRQLIPVRWPTVPITERQPVTRDESRRRQTEPPTFLQRLLGLIPDHDLPATADGTVMAYWALLDRVLEDRHVDDSEADALVETAASWGLSGDQIEHAHRDYLNELAIAAVADEITTEAERRDLELVARLLGQEKRDLDAMLNEATAKVTETHRDPALDPAAEVSLLGMRICFTGELQGLHDGQLVSRQLAEELATEAGLHVADSVTKKLDLLVLADPQSQSGKAKRARRYGIRIIQELVFWKAIGVQIE